jgi:mRNA-degrading endonuclease RelE of RelBE toxin-antitoxin system
LAAEIAFYRRARKALRSLPRIDCTGMLERLETYAADPDDPRHAVPALAGEESTSRLRVGDWRVLFDREDDKIEICVVRHRRESYSMSTDPQVAEPTGLEAEGLEDRFDTALAKLARAEQANLETVPFVIVRRLVDGEVPVTVWREHRGLSQDQLAVAASVPAERLTEIETGKEDVPLRMMHAIALALRVDLDDLVPWSVAAEDPAEAAPSP